MTDLQMGLIGLGAAAVVGVFAYNKWNEYKHRKLAEQLLKAQHTDVLLNDAEARETAPVFTTREPDPDFEPELDAGPAAESISVMAENRVAPASSGERIEPVFHIDTEPSERQEPRMARRETPVEPVDLPEPTTATPAYKPEPAPEPVHEVREVPEPFHLLSPIIDYVASFEAVEPAPAYQILESQGGTLARIRKPVHWIGYNEQSREWEPIIDDGVSEYRRLRVGLQLVDRRGPVSEVDLSAFQMAMQDLADQMMAITELPQRQAAFENALKLDEFCASVDIQIGINVISQGQVFPGTKLRALAEAAGMVIDDEGRFVRCDDDGNVLYVLLNQEASGFSVEAMKTMSTHGITFLLDVPRVAHGERVFNQMVELAKRFSDVLRGALVDDNRRPLSEAALEPIRRQVAQYQSMMGANSLPAGGPLTRRLFS